MGDDLIAPNIDTLEDMKPLNPVDVEARALFHTKTSTQVVTGNLDCFPSLVNSFV